jgi:hypothetical protein
MPRSAPAKHVLLILYASSEHEIAHGAGGTNRGTKSSAFAVVCVQKACTHAAAFCAHATLRPSAASSPGTSSLGARGFDLEAVCYKSRSH